MRNFLLYFLVTSTLFASDFEKSTNIVIDKKQNLMWQDNLESTQYKEDITMGKTYCENLILNGYIDWRMATIKELQSILDITNKNTTIKKEFLHTNPTKYWSSSYNIAQQNSFWYIDFKSGRVEFENQNQQNSIRCVRNLK